MLEGSKARQRFRNSGSGLIRTFNDRRRRSKRLKVDGHRSAGQSKSVQSAKVRSFATKLDGL